MRATQIPITKPLAAADRNTMDKQGAFTATMGGIPCVSVDPISDTPLVRAVTGRCCKYDLSVDDEREAYADLSAKLVIGVDLIKLWEERIKTDTGSVIIYVNYVEMALVADATARG